MYVPQGVQVPCVNLAADVDLDDIHPWAADLDTAQKMVSEGTAPSLFYFVENAKQLEKKVGKLAIRSLRNKGPFFISVKKL